MIKDKIDNYLLYAGINTRINKAFQYIINTDLEALATGKHVISGDEVFALVNEYETKNQNDSIIEAHHKYIDLQYMISGTENMGFTTLLNQIPYESSEEKDYDFYHADIDMIKLEKDMFMLLFPNDLHMPGVCVDKPSLVKKMVIKIKIQ